MHNSRSIWNATLNYIHKSCHLVAEELFDLYSFILSNSNFHVNQMMFYRDTNRVEVSVVVTQLDAFYILRVLSFLLKITVYLKRV